MPASALGSSTEIDNVFCPYHPHPTKFAHPENYGSHLDMIGTAFALSLNARRARPKTDQRGGYLNPMRPSFRSR